MKQNNRQLVDKYVADTPPPQPASTIYSVVSTNLKMFALHCLFPLLLSIMTQKVSECLRE